MNRRLYATLAICIGLAVAWPVKFISTALAQQDHEMIMEEIVVVAPRLVRREEVGRTAGGASVELITLTRRVSYADLDLEMYADVMELEKRVNDMAEEACELIADAFPMVDAEPSNVECVRQAVDGAMMQVREAAAEAAR